MVDNCAGAGGIIAAELAAKLRRMATPPLFATDSTLTVNPQLHPPSALRSRARFHRDSISYLQPFAITAPATTPGSIVRRLNRPKWSAILGMADVRAKLTAAGYEIIANTPEEMAAQMKREESVENGRA